MKSCDVSTCSYKALPAPDSVITPVEAGVPSCRLPSVESGLRRVLSPTWRRYSMPSVSEETIIYYYKSLSVCRLQLANCRSTFLPDRLGRSLKLFVSTESTSCHDFASQFGLEMFIIGEKTKQKSSVQLIVRSRLTTTDTAVAVVAVYIDCDKTATSQNIGFPLGLQPVSRHATGTILTGPTFMRKSFIDDFPIDCATVLMIFPSTSTRLVVAIMARTLQ